MERMSTQQTGKANGALGKIHCRPLMDSNSYSKTKLNKGLKTIRHTSRIVCLYAFSCYYVLLVEGLHTVGPF